MKKGQKLSPHMEDYIEAIAFLKEKNQVARVKDISSALNVKASSVTAALANLSKNNLVIHERYGYVQLTSEGERLAAIVSKKYQILIDFLTKILGINPEIASEDACKMEHSISPQTFEKLTKFMEFIETSPIAGKPEWLKGFDYYFKTGKRRKCRIYPNKGNIKDLKV